MPYLKGRKVAGRIDFCEIEVRHVRDEHVNVNVLIHLLYMTCRIKKTKQNILFFTGLPGLSD